MRPSLAAVVTTVSLLVLAPPTSRAQTAPTLAPSADPQADIIPDVKEAPLFREPNHPLDERIADLTRRLSLREKVSLIVNSSPGVKRLGIPPYDVWNECLHGVARAGVATVFPQAIGMAATWDIPLVTRIADTISTEARAKYNDAQAHGNYAQYYGLTFWTPNINLFRDPRWGRGQETYGEDPYLTGRLAVAFIKGLQGKDPTYIKAMACAKHFAVHSGPESERHTFDAVPTENDFYDSYLPQFEAAVREGNVGGVMGAYNRVFGEPACSSPLLLNQLLRQKWGFTGYVVSDCGAIGDIWSHHKVVSSPEEASARAVKAGCDIECGTDYLHLVQAVRSGLITEPEIDRALSYALGARFRLGMFDPPELVPFSKIPLAEVDSPSHGALALQAAREAIVLLKNSGVLPLDLTKVKRIAVIGANANSTPMLLGNYNGDASRPISILQGIRESADKGPTITYTQGCPLALPPGAVIDEKSEEFRKALKNAIASDVVVYVGGLNSEMEGEEMSVNFDGFSGGDRTQIELPAVQTALLKALQATGKPVIFVNCSGSAIAMPWEAERLAAIVQAWYPGQAGGWAVADVLFGHYNPSGRLPVTFYRATSDLPSFTDYRMANRTYRFFGGNPLFPFGYGLSYTQFRYGSVGVANSSVTPKDSVKLTVMVANAGGRDGDEIVQVYAHRIGETDTRLASKSLCAFRRISLSAKTSMAVDIVIPVSNFRHWSEQQKDYVVDPGQYELLIGSSSSDIRIKTTLDVTASH